MESVIDPIVAYKADKPRLWEASNLPQEPAALADERYHDAAAATYDNWENVPWMAHAEAWIVPWITAHANEGIVVDLGTGTGRIARALARSGSTNVIAVDRSQRMLDIALAKTEGQRVLALRADATELPIFDGSVDAVTCSGVLHHVVRPQRVVAEVARILRPGGRIVVREPNADYPAHWFAPLERLAERLSPAASHRATGYDGEPHHRAPDEHPILQAQLLEWLTPLFVPEFVGSAKLLASVSLPVGMLGQDAYYRLANWIDRLCLLPLLPQRGSLVLAVARRT
jgi:ubiquinone/menaquinone biosynthesis C-methylase UbiE